MNDDELENMFNGGMDDEEFRRLFTRIMKERQKEMDKFLRGMYGMGFNPFNFPQSPSSRDNGVTGNTENNDRMYDMFTKLFGNPDDGTNNPDENGWDTKNWMSPDGSMSFSSSSRVFRMDPDEANRVFGEVEKEDPIDVLKKKMAIAIEDQRYEDAAKLRDAIKTLMGEEEDNLSKLKRANREDEEENSNNSEK
jgi:hypothetical protein